MTRFIAAYDTEMYDTSSIPHDPTCLKACERITAIHREYGIPAAFFIVGKALLCDPEAYRNLLDDPLFEIASHSYSHKLFRDHPICGNAPPIDEIRTEIIDGKKVIGDVFGRTCGGIRSGVGYANGLKGAPEILEIIQTAGYDYISTQLWGADYSLPAPVAPSYTYGEEGYPGISGPWMA